jgi:hypothetical protein
VVLVGKERKRKEIQKQYLARRIPFAKHPIEQVLLAHFPPIVTFFCCFPLSFFEPFRPDFPLLLVWAPTSGACSLPTAATEAGCVLGLFDTAAGLDVDVGVDEDEEDELVSLLDFSGVDGPGETFETKFVASL